MGIRPLSLGRRIVASVAFGLALILLLFGLVALWTVHESIEAAYRERVTLAQAMSTRVDDVLRYSLETLQREADDFVIEPGRPLTEEQRRRLAGLHFQLGVSAALFVTNAEGSTLWADPEVVDILPGSSLLHPDVRLILRSGQPAITVLPSLSGNKRILACVAVPLRDSSHRFAGVLMAGIDPGHPALNLVPTGEMGDGMHAQLMNTNGELLAGAKSFSPKATAEHRALLDPLMATRSAGYRLHEPSGGATFSPHVVAYAPVSLLPTWGVTVEQTTDLVLAMPNRLGQRLALFGLAALLLAAAVAWFDVRRVVRPLKDLTASAEQFAAGHLEKPVQLERADELGVLARAFDTMRQRLRASLDEVAEWNRSALLDPNRVIALVMRKARDLIGTEVAGLSLLEEGSGDLIWNLIGGAGDRFHQIRRGLGEGIAGQVVQTGRPLVITDWEQTPADGPATAPILGMESLRAVLAVPLQSGGRTFGALMVANRTPTIFSDDQRALLSSLANQAAVALENVRLYRKVQSLAVLEERERIAREMHDGLGQVLGYVNTKTLAVARLLEVGKVDEASAQIAQLESMARAVYADVREAILGLRTTLGPEHGFLVALREYLEGFERHSGIPVELQAPAPQSGLRIPFSSEIQLIRIVQEALANVRKHAKANRAEVHVASADGVVRLVIEDDGQGFDPTRLVHEGWPRFGLQTMRERAEAIRGSFAVESRLGAGTRVVVTIPQEQEEEVADVPDARPAGR